MMNKYVGVWICVGLVLVVAAGAAEQKADKNNKTVESLYPGLASGALTFARLSGLPSGVLLRADTVEIAASELEKELAGAPAAVQPQLKKNGFFLLENLATKKLLLHVAGKNAGMAKAAVEQDDAKIIQAYLERTLGSIQVTDAEVKEFYEANKDMCGGATLDQVKADLKNYVLQEKRQKAVREHVRTLGKRMAIELSAPWVAQQAILAKDNPVDKARGGGLPSLVDFGASGCRPCDMMTPILEALKKKYEGKLNVLFVHVREEQILAARYGVESIPVQVFFDKDGKEVSRHTGFFPQSEIEKKLSEVGVK
jgi:thiol-disulfide isomerase/thioredoxin